MRIGIKYRLFLAILLASILAIVVLVGLMQWNLSRGFFRFVRQSEQASIEKLVDTLELFYQEQHSWQPLRESPHRWNQLIFLALLPQPEQHQHHRPAQPPPGPRMLPPNLIDDFARRLVLLDWQRIPLTQDFGQRESVQQIPLHVTDQLVGYLQFTPLTQLTDDRHLGFLHEQKLTFLQVAAIILLLSALLSYLVARRMIQPMAELATATRKLTGGVYDIRVPVTTNDELGHLAEDFNLLALTLKKNEQARRQWVADISHELRTPIGILRGETEALIDGVRQPTPTALQSLHAETGRLTRLVEDLYQLSLSDLGALNYRKQKLDVMGLIEELCLTYKMDFERQRLRTTVDSSEQLETFIFGDRERLRQLFSNLFDNTLKYTDPGGELRITLSNQANSLLIAFQDTAPAVDETKLDKLFERLYRVESSRNRETGGAGLGLAICRNIIEAHQGRISAENSPLGGLSIQMTLPFAEKN